MDGGIVAAEITLIARRTDWCELATSHMAMIEDQPAHVSNDFYMVEVAAERAELIGVYAVGPAGEERVGSLVARIEFGDMGKELVIMAAGGRSPVNAVPALFPVWEKLARDAGCVSARFETSRAGLIQWAKRRGWRACSVNLRVDL